MRGVANFSVGDFDLFLKEQDGKCAICNKSDHLGTALSVDHEHATGRVRGLLCRKCNSVLGIFEEDITRFASAIAYLEKFRQEGSAL
jgi:hypothetical protein